MKKFNLYEKGMPYLVGGSIKPSTEGERELEHKCNPHPNDWVDNLDCQKDKTRYLYHKPTKKEL